MAAAVGVDVGAEHAGLLAVGDRLADQPEVVAQQRRREALHELHRLAQLDLEDDGEVAVAAEPFEVQPGDAAQPLGGIGDAVERGAALGEHLAHRALEDRDQQVVLALEVEIDGAGRHAGGAGDVGDLRLEEAVLGEDLGGGAQDGVALVAAAAAVLPDRR